MRDIPDVANVDYNVKQAIMLSGRDTTETFFIDEANETDSFNTAYSVFKFYNKIHHQFYKELPKFQSFMKDLEDFLAFYSNNYLLHGIIPKVDFCIYSIEEIRAKSLRVLKFINRMWRTIELDMGHIVLCASIDDIKRERFSMSAIPLLTTMYMNLRSVSDHVEYLIRKSNMYFRLKCYVLSHVIPN